MADIAAKRNPNRCPTHPGALLREDILPALNMSKSAIAGAIGISRQHLYDILGEKKPVSPEVAVRLGKAFGDAGVGDNGTDRAELLLDALVGGAGRRGVADVEGDAHRRGITNVGGDADRLDGEQGDRLLGAVEIAGRDLPTLGREGEGGGTPDPPGRPGDQRARS